MKRPNALWLIPLAAAVLLLVPIAASAQSPNAAALGTVPAGAGGSVFVMSNTVSGNSVLAFRIAAGGALVPAGSFATHGKGTGASLADAGSVVLAKDHRFLLVVNAGSDSVTVFGVHARGSGSPVLTFVSQASSRGVDPVSLAVHGSVVYVLNDGNATVPGNIVGFLLADHGLLLPLPGARQALSTSAATGAAQVAFNPAGTVLVVTEKNTNLLDTFPVNGFGIAQSPTFTTSNGTTPYGFAFAASGTLIVSDAASDALSSYSVTTSGVVSVVSGSVGDGQVAPCWVAVANGGTLAITSDAHSNNISTYAIGAGGSLSLLASSAATTGAADTDLAIGGSAHQYLFVTDAGSAEVQEFQIGASGSLTLLYTVSSLPATVEGMAAF